MKLAFVAHSHGNLALLERALITLVERFEATRVFALESAAYDAEAVVRARRQRYPAEVEWRDQDYPDFVLASVLAGVVQAPRDAVALTERIAEALTISPRGGDVVDLGGRTIGIGVTTSDPATMAAVVLPAVARRQISVDTPPARLAPGHVRAQMHENEPASCLIVGVVDDGLQAQYVSPTGERLGQAVNLSVLSVRVAIYGGAFDPPHLAHVFTLTYLLTRADVDAVWVLPAADHAFGKRMTPYAERRAMLDTLIASLGSPRLRVDDIETESTGRTFDTLSLLAERHPDHRFTLVIGADNLTESHRWHRFDELAARFGVIALGRPGHERALAEAAKAPWCQAGPTLAGVSSTRLRSALAGGDPVALRWLPEVLKAPAARLYGTRAPRADLPSVWIFGGGRLGTSLAAAWRAAGVDVRGIWRRSVDGDLPAEAPADVWIIAVSDPAIPQVARQLADLPPPAVALHCAGRFDASILAPLACARGSLHPLQSIGDDPGALRGAYCAVEGAPEAADAARALAEAFGGRPVTVPSGEKPAYHAAAVLSANFMTTLAAAGVALLEAIGVEAPTARRMLTPLWQGTLNRNATLDAAEALTGPLARQDLDAIDAHVRALARHAPQFSAAYAELARTTAAWMGWPEAAQAALDRALLGHPDLS